ncbi:hypothetical protein [Xanthomonas theicola]|uniref:hypothetical protein n=1 Tax=Xanthomonas theicola TaxID=56464 RepID=UPI001304BE28|nr:hypothetical protein [Xanthomonas theicola]QNH23626.1 hypothetical protein G4Q83_00990 [Xanthomonas theicola]
MKRRPLAAFGARGGAVATAGLDAADKQDIPEGWLAAWRASRWGVDILMEVNDRRIGVYMRAHVTTKQPHDPGNPRRCHRNALIQVWTHAY